MRTITDRETELKAELQSLIASGAGADLIVAAAEAVANQIIEAAEAEASLFGSRKGVPMTPEQRQHLKDVWTPEKRAEQSAKLKGRTLTPEQREKLSNSLKQTKAKREEEKAALLARIAELEAQMSGNGTAVAEGEPEVEGEGRRGRRR